MPKVTIFKSSKFQTKETIFVVDADASMAGKNPTKKYIAAQGVCFEGTMSNYITSVIKMTCTAFVRVLYCHTSYIHIKKNI